MKNKGFTLIEVIAVIAILAIVLALAGPNIFKFRDRANEKALKSKIDNLATITEQYIENNSNDIVYKCGGHLSGCSEYCYSYNSSNNTCQFRISSLVDKKLYTESCRKTKTDETTGEKICQDKCKISDPTDENNCLENHSFSVTINLSSNTAKATYVE